MKKNEYRLSSFEKISKRKEDVMNNVVPSLSDDKWVSNSKLKLLKAYLYFIIADYAQTDIYKYQITSLKYIIYEYGNDTIDKFNNELTKQLKKYLENFFVSVDIKVKQEDSNDLNINLISIHVVVTDENNNTISLENVLKIKDNKLDNIYELIAELNERIL